MKTLPAEKEALLKGLIVDLYERVDYYVKNTSDPLNENEQIEEVITKIIEIENEYNVDLPNRENHWKEFNDWCGKNGAPIEKFLIKKINNEEYGLFANSNFNMNDVVFEIGRKLFMTNETALNDIKLANFTQDVIFKHMPNLILTFHLISENYKSNSFWAPYIKTLPRNYSTILYMNHNDLVQLKGSSLLEEVVKIKRNVARQYAYFWMKISNERIKSFGNFTYDIYRWALSTIMTRQNSIPCKSDKKKTTFALIPLWDMCNHKHGKMVTDYDTIKDCLIFYAMNDFKNGDEIYNCYGERSNSDFFLHNGFFYDDHVNDTIKVKIGISKADPLFTLKDTLCRKIDLDTNGFYELGPKSDKLEKKVLAIIRIFFLSKEELEDWIASKTSEKLYDESQLKHLKGKVQEFLSMRCKLLLKRYPQIDKFTNPCIEKLIKREKKILQSYVM